jgi:hypothetical protein
MSVEQIEKLYLELNELKVKSAELYRKATNVRVHELPPDPMAEWNAVADQIHLKIRQLKELLCETGADNRKYPLN